jgi:hypothetical protein
MVIHKNLIKEKNDMVLVVTDEWVFCEKPVRRKK